MRDPRTYLFVSGSKPHQFPKAAATGAEIIIDLEDAVAEAEKNTARDTLIDWFSAGRQGLVRINATETAWFEDDIAVVANCQLASVMVPKADLRSLRLVSDLLPGRPLIALVETVAGLLDIQSLVRVPGVTRLAFGSLDFGLDAGIPDVGVALDPARFLIVIHSCAAGLPPPIDGVTANFADDSATRQDSCRAKSLGFSAKMCIHPRQVPIVEDCLGPSDTEVLWAQRVVDALAASSGSAVQIEGKMIDRPVAEKARAILSSHSR